MVRPPAGEAAMSHSLLKPAANVHLGKEAFALLKVGGLWFLQGCEPMRFYHVSYTFVTGLHIQAISLHWGWDCLLLLSKNKQKNIKNSLEGISKGGWNSD